MTSTTARSAAYLDDLARMLGSLDAEERADVLDGVRDHIEAALTRLEREPTDADLDRILAELGSPGEVAQAALAGRSSGATAVAPVPRPALAGAWVPPTAVGLIFLGALFGVFVFPIALLLVGLVLLWVSPLWTAVEKLVGTLVPVLGLGGTLAGTLMITLVSAPDGTEPSGPSPIGYLLIAAALAAIATLVWLAVRGGRRARGGIVAAT